MNDLNRAVAHKLRSAAAALRADAAESNFVNLREALLTEIVEMEKRADELEDQPAIDEPTEFGSIVQARWSEAPNDSPLMPWLYCPWLGEHRWRSGDGLNAVWSDLRDVEVLRVGVGDTPVPSYSASDVIRATARTMRVCISDVAPCGEQDCNSCFPPPMAEEDAYNKGVSDTVSALVARLQEKRYATNLTAARGAYTEAIQIAEAL